MDMVLIGGAAVGLVMGSFGYVLVRFGARPVIAYRRLKSRLDGLLKTVAAEKGMTAQSGQALRQMAVTLQEMTDNEIPVWYRLSLQKKGEQPQEAVRHLQSLANCKEKKAIQKRIAAVRQNLGLG